MLTRELKERHRVGIGALLGGEDRDAMDMLSSSEDEASSAACC